MVTITKKFSFCYGHQLPGYDGPCANIHGHNSELEVEISGKDADSYAGMIMDFGELKTLIQHIIKPLDHKFLNDIPELSLKPPIAENLVQYIAQALFDCLPLGVKLERVRMTETPDSWAEWRNT